MKHHLAPLASAVILLSTLPARADSLWVETEAGRVTARSLDVRIPSDGGTLLSLTDDLSADGTAVFRGRLGWRLNARHELLVTAAPLELEARGAVPFPVRFDEGEFPAGAPLRATYRFDSYRLTWRRTLRDDDRWRLAAGATAFVRDAEVAVRGGGLSESDRNIGFVPLLHLRADWRPGARWGLCLEGDGMAAPQGRAFDVRLAVRARLAEGVEFTCGYRLIEGGADGDAVYTFAWLDHVTAAIAVRF